MREAAEAAAAAAAAEDESLAPGITEGIATGGEMDLPEHTDSGERETTEEEDVVTSGAVVERMFSGDIIMFTSENANGSCGVGG